MPICRSHLSAQVKVGRLLPLLQIRKLPVIKHVHPSSGFGQDVLQGTKEMAFQRVEFQKFSGTKCPRTPPKNSSLWRSPWRRRRSSPAILKNVTENPAGLQVKNGQERAWLRWSQIHFRIFPVSPGTDTFSASRRGVSELSGLYSHISWTCTDASHAYCCEAGVC